MYVLIPMIIGPVVAQEVINAFNKGVADSDIVYPMELFLAGAVVMLFCFIPARIVRDNQDKRHKELLEDIVNEK